MSGEAFQGLEYPLYDAIITITAQHKPLYTAFAKHLELVKQALHDVNYVISGDMSEGKEVEAIKACLGEHWQELTLQSALEQIGEIQDKLIELMEEER
jgi:hypothetical protein